MNNDRMNGRREKHEDAVSPVIGVMLMLVVTIIIAAVISGFAGELVGTTEKAPQLVMDVEIKNTGDMWTSWVVFDIKSVSEPIHTRDLRIATSWRTTNKTANDGSIITGGATVAAGVENTNYSTSDEATNGQFRMVSPIGHGQGVTQLQEFEYQKTAPPYDPGQYFGNYTLTVGTAMRQSPARYGPAHRKDLAADEYLELYEYHPTHVERDQRDSVQAILGKDWTHLRMGDVVDIKITHLPSGQVIFDKSVVVQG